LERVIASLAGEAVFGDSANTDQILAALREDDTIDLVAPFAKNDIGQRQAVGHKLRKLRARTLTDSRGRRFEFGRSEDAHGARYTFHFLHDAGG
jgi:ribosomal protein L19E